MILMIHTLLKEKKTDDFHDDTINFLNLRNEINKGLLYFGGYLAYKFPQCEFLGSHVTACNISWNTVASWRPGGLKTPSESFVCDLKKDGGTFLMLPLPRITDPEQAEKNSTNKLTLQICNHVKLSQEGIQLFVSSRIFSRMRILNRNLKLPRSEKKDILKTS